MCWEGVKKPRMQGIERDPQQDKLGHQTLIGFRIFFLARAKPTDRSVTVNIEEYHVVLFPEEEAALSSRDTLQSLGAWPAAPGNCQISDLCFFCGSWII